VRERLGDFDADHSRAYDHGLADHVPVDELLDPAHVLVPGERKHAAEVSTGDGRHERHAAGCEQQLAIGQDATILEDNLVGSRLDLSRGDAEDGVHVGLLVEVAGTIVHLLLGDLAREAVGDER